MSGSLEDLLAGCRSGDDQAIEELVRRFQFWATDLARALTGDADLAEDVAQESFVTALQQLARLRDNSAFPAWFRQIIRTQANRQLRVRREIPTADMPDSPASASDAREILEKSQLNEIVRNAISRLPEKSREAIERFYLREDSVADIASSLGVPKGTVTRRLHDGRKRMRVMLLGLPETEHLRAKRERPPKTRKPMSL